jgi:hypothetical protein
MKDKPGPTRLVGGPSMAASELVDMVQDIGTFWCVRVMAIAARLRLC